MLKMKTTLEMLLKLRYLELDYVSKKLALVQLPDSRLGLHSLNKNEASSLNLSTKLAALKKIDYLLLLRIIEHTPIQHFLGIPSESPQINRKK